MMLPALLIGMLVPVLQGLLLLRIFERKVRVLSHPERLAAALLLGMPLGNFVLFFALLLGVPVTLVGFLAVHGALLILLSFLVWKFARGSFKDVLLPKDSPRLSLSLKSIPLPFKVIGGIFLFWMILKIVAGAYDLLSIPSYFDDTYANWNMRAKAFYESQSLLLDLPRTDPFFFGGRVPSYPLTIYLTKVWLALLNGEWSDTLVNGVHLVWFALLLTLIFGSLSRLLSSLWGFLGVYILVSLPLVFMHGVNAYTDVLLSASLFLPLLSFYQWMEENDRERKTVWFFLLSVASAAILFVKSEALLLFLPPLLLLFGIASFFEKESLLVWGRHLSKYVGIVALVASPWILFKAYYGLEFGNAQAVGKFALSLHSEVPEAILNDLLHTGSYLLFFSVFLLIVILSFREWVRKPIGFLLLFLGIVLVGQFLIYYLTPLATEAVKHTGYGRGIVQLLPSLTFSAILLLQYIIATLIADRSRGLPFLARKS
jgi:hypothetical protein